MAMDSDPVDDDAKPAHTGSGAIFTAGMLFLVIVFVALGSWQVQRLFWKLDLIARIEARIHAQPVAVPAPSQWSSINQDKDEYRRVTATGVFLHDRQVLVQAVTELGAGFWVVTPMNLPDGATILINRGFVPPDHRDAVLHSVDQPSPIVSVMGLMRMPEPGGAFLRSNDPASGRWYSRDVTAIATAEGLDRVAPFFLDADATANPGGFPIGGMTVVSFRNSHLVYALTWYLLAIMSGVGLYVVRRQRTV
ncbi:SURF1 family protein [Rhizobium sp. 18065]|uniref:SURF1 family protein n=1 Tax=Rhizobium sp. 18065 TaxID=2681411 RepID=UPI00135B4F4E|nr:SURF1 family protein [Rhizobium sp. 18065]